MVKNLGVFCAVVAVLFAGISPAGEKKADPQMVQTLMNKSGLNRQLEQMPLLIQAGIAEANQETQALSPQAVDELSSTAAVAFDPQVLKKNVQKHILENLPEDDMRAAVTWLNSPLGEKIKQLDEKTETPEAYQAMLKMAEKLTGNRARVEMVKKLDKAVKATETGVAASMTTQAALIVALTSKMKPDKRPSFEAIVNMVAENRGELETAVEQQNILGFLYSYNELTDGEIGQYLQFAESASGRKYHTAVADGFNNALAAAARTLGTQIERSSGQEMQEIRKKQKNSAVMNAFLSAATALMK